MHIILFNLRCHLICIYIYTYVYIYFKACTRMKNESVGWQTFFHIRNEVSHTDDTQCKMSNYKNRYVTLSTWICIGCNKLSWLDIYIYWLNIIFCVVMRDNVQCILLGTQIIVLILPVFPHNIQVKCTTNTQCNLAFVRYVFCTSTQFNVLIYKRYSQIQPACNSLSSYDPLPTRPTPFVPPT